MNQITIDPTTLKHALRNLNKNEILLILQDFNFIDTTIPTKQGLVDYIINLLSESQLPEDMYFAIREKAFSINKNFFDGFFYKIDELYTHLDTCQIENALTTTIIGNNPDKKTTITSINKTNDKLIFNFNQTKIIHFHDYSENLSKSYKQVINADIYIYCKEGLVYIHSKNLTESQTIKTFLDKIFNSIEVDGEKRKKVLIEPKFDIQTVDNWYKEHSIPINKRINNYSLHMLDLYYLFTSDDSSFSEVSMLGIYLKEITSANDTDTKITAIKYEGINLQNHQQINEQIKNGKQIKGFKIQVEHLYEDEDTGEAIPTQLPITFLYEDNKFFRLSFSSELLSCVRSEVLNQAYQNVKDLFISKYTKNTITSTEELLEFLTDLEEESQPKSDKEPIKLTTQRKWSF